MMTLHFIESYKNIPSDWESNQELKEGAELYCDFLIEKDIAQVEFNKEHPDQYYIHDKIFPIVEEIFIDKKVKGERKSVRFSCLEFKIGQKLYWDWKWETPEVREAYVESIVLGHDYYKRFVDQDSGDDYLDNLKDRTKYASESKKIESIRKEFKDEK